MKNTIASHGPSPYYSSYHRPPLGEHPPTDIAYLTNTRVQFHRTRNSYIITVSTVKALCVNLTTARRGRKVTATNRCVLSLPRLIRSPRTRREESAIQTLLVRCTCSSIAATVDDKGARTERVAAAVTGHEKRESAIHRHRSVARAQENADVRYCALTIIFVFPLSWAPNEQTIKYVRRRPMTSCFSVLFYAQIRRSSPVDDGYRATYDFLPGFSSENGGDTICSSPTSSDCR